MSELLRSRIESAVLTAAFLENPNPIDAGSIILGSFVAGPWFWAVLAVLGQRG